MREEVHYLAYGCSCHHSWGDMFPTEEDGTVVMGITVKLTLSGKGGGQLAFLLDDVLVLQHLLTPSGEPDEFYTTAKYFHPDWAVKSLQILKVFVRPMSSDGYIEVEYQDPGGLKLLGFDLQPNGLTTDKATKQDTIH